MLMYEPENDLRLTLQLKLEMQIDNRYELGDLQRMSLCLDRLRRQYIHPHSGLESKTSLDNQSWIKSLTKTQANVKSSQIPFKLLVSVDEDNEFRI